MLRNVAIYAFSLGKFSGVRKYACVKDLTNIMSVCSSSLLSFFLHTTSFKIVLGDIAREKAAVEKELSKGVRFSSLIL